MKRFFSNHIRARGGRRDKLAFTLIELLVVITIIGLLAALVVSGAGYATVAARKSRVQAERNALVVAIEQYKAHKGFYPPDNTSNSACAGLYYELTGTVPSNSPSFGVGFMAASGEFLATNDMYTLFKVTGFLNSSSDASQPEENFFGTAGKSTRTGSFYISGNSGPTYTVFGVPVPPGAPSSLGTFASGVPVNPWHYVSTNPTNNTTEFDLWMDVSWRGKTNRISNWTSDPVPLP